MTIAQIKSGADTAIRNKVAASSISPANVADQINVIADEFLARGIAHVDDTTALQALSGANYKLAIVKDGGIFEHLSSGTANGTTIFNASGGGVFSIVSRVVSGLTANRLPFAGTGLTLTDDATLFFDPTLKRLVVRGNSAPDDNPILELGTNAYNTTKPYLVMKAPIDYTVGAFTQDDFKFQFMPGDNGDGTFNNVMKWGFNIDGEDAGKSGIFYSMEPDWLSGGVRFRENHLTYSYTDGTQIRLFSSTLQQRATLLLTTNQWDFRCNNFIVSDLGNGGLGNNYFGVSRASNADTPQNVELLLAGLNPVMTMEDTGSSALFRFQNDGVGGTVLAGGLKIVSKYATDANLIIPTVGGTSSHADIAFEKVSGGRIWFSYYDVAAGGGLADELIFFDQTLSKIFLRYRSATGKVLIGDTGGQSDTGQALQIYGTCKISDLPTFADEAAAAALATGTLYKTATGEVRVKL